MTGGQRVRKSRSICRVVGIALSLAVVTLLAPTSASASTFSNRGPIPMANPGKGNPYPSTIVVSGLTGNVAKARATLHGVVHGRPLDIETLLVGPGGQSTSLMGNTCGIESTPLTGQTFTFDDAASASLPNSGPCSSGTYRPSNGALNNSFMISPAPPGPYALTLSVFNGTPSNGIWQLYAQDDNPGPGGSIGGGWSLELLTDARCAGKPATMTGTAGDDNLIGTTGPDVILGFDGNDTISGLDGKDVECGGNGKDKLKGGKGKDTLIGENGKDKLKGGGANDVCKGGKGNDSASACEKERSI